MLHVRLVSGQEVAAIPMEEVKSVREVKRYLHQHHGLAPRFRQRLMLKGSNMKLDDASEIDAAPMDLALVVVSFSEPSQTQVSKLIAAASSGSAKEVESLLQLPLDPNVVTRFAERPLLPRASFGGHVEVVRLLLEARADKDLLDRGRTALMIAAKHGHVEIVRLLVEAGADKEVSDSGLTALMLAAGRGHVEVARLLVEAGADKDKADTEGRTALMIAESRGRVEVARLLSESVAKRRRVSGLDKP